MDLFESEKPIITNESALLEAFVPTRLLHREGQTQQLAGALEPVSMGRNPRNVFLYGDTGVGKTSLVKWMFKELAQHTSRGRMVYINCWNNPSSHAVLARIVYSLQLFATPKQPESELLQLIESWAERSGKKLVICLDEVDQLNEDKLLYTFSRMDFGLLLISNDRYALKDVDQRIRSSLTPEDIEFSSYKADELFDILKDRASFALAPGSVADEHLKMLASMAKGDARRGLDLLRRAALNAEGTGKTRIDIHDIKKASETQAPPKEARVLEGLNSEQKMLYNIVKRERRISTGDLFQKYTAEGGQASDRTYRKYLEDMVKRKAVKASGSGRWRVYEVLS